MKSIFISATSTDIGKTFVSAGILAALKSKGINVSYYKPVESGGIKTKMGFLSADSKWVSEYSGCEYIYNDYCFEKPMSPHLAARLENKTIDPLLIKKKYKELIEQHDFVLVEGAGGLWVPLIEYNYMVYDLVLDLDVELIIVADAGLGSINHTCLTVALAKEKGIEIVGIILNNYNDSVIHKENLNAIETLTGVKVLMTIPKIDLEKDKMIFKNYFESIFPVGIILGEVESI